MRYRTLTWIAAPMVALAFAGCEVQRDEQQTEDMPATETEQGELPAPEQEPGMEQQPDQRGTPDMGGQQDTAGMRTPDMNGGTNGSGQQM